MMLRISHMTPGRAFHASGCFAVCSHLMLVSVPVLLETTPSVWNPILL